VELSPGDRIGNYRIECELGPTGAWLLFQAQHLVLPRRAVIKVIQAGFASNQLLVVQTLREACILEAIAHPGVPIVYETGRLPDRRPWFAFEANSGPTLDALLASGPLSVIEVAALVRDLADILEHAHYRGVIHRGLRPNRVVITAARRYPLYIPDWSEAIVHDATGDVRYTVLEGSRSYVAPELLRHGVGAQGAIDDRVDVFALGVIAHRALTGGLPVARGLGAEPFAPSHERRPDAPRALTALIDSMLAFDRLDRPGAADVRAGVEWLFATTSQLQGASAPARETRQPVVPVPMSPDELVAQSQRLRFRRPRWTPEVRYVETTEATGEASGDATGSDAGEDLMD
jgi:eukaryotic-like serine/threonine-protein kinase